MKEKLKKMIVGVILLARSKWLLCNMERQRKNCERILCMAKKQRAKTDEAYNEFKAFQEKYLKDWNINEE